MKTFNSINEIKKWVNSSDGQSSVLNEAEMVKVLTEAGQELEGYLRDELEKYFQSYDPVVYQRTGNTLASIRVGKPRKISINQWTLDITFDESLANHPSVFGQEDGYTPWLLHAGWKNRLDSKLNKENFTRFKGTNFITHAVELFNRNNKHGLKVYVTRNGEDVPDRYYNYGK